MASILNGMSDVYSLTAKINALKNQSTGAAQSKTDPNNAILELQQSFNEMLNNLLASSDDDKDNKKTDPFAFITDYQKSLDELNAQKNPANNANPQRGLDGNPAGL